MKENKNRIPVNNGYFLRVQPGNDEIIVYKENEHGALVTMGEIITGADFVQMFNWYKYQKENGNENLLF